VNDKKTLDAALRAAFQAGKEHALSNEGGRPVLSDDLAYEAWRNSWTGWNSHE
jgi:hypothetical protein